MRSLCLALLCGLSCACQSPPEDLRTWKPSDHTNTGTATTSAQSNRPRQSTGEARSTVPGLDEVTIATWRSNCVVCHGSMGRGDGPQAAMFKPRDLSDPQWQGSVTDAQIYEVIQKGRNKMPAFALPQNVAESLVKLIRLLGGHRPGQAPAPGSSGKATASPAAPVAGGDVAAKGARPPSAGSAVAAPEPEGASAPLGAGGRASK